MGSFSALQEPSVEFGAIVAGGTGREVVFGYALPRGDLFIRFCRVAPKVSCGLLRGHPFARLYVGQVFCCLGQNVDRLCQRQGDPRERLDFDVFEDTFGLLQL